MIPRTACHPWGAANLVKSWYGHWTVTLTVALSTQVYKLIGAGEFNAEGNPAMD